jgi:hypothetical protein
MQVIRSDSPFPYPQLVLSIKYSDSENSGWGLFAQSVARALNISLQDVAPMMLVQHQYHLVRHDDHLFFTNRTTGEEARGTYWEMLALVADGAAVVPWVSPNSAPAAAAPTQPVAVAPVPVPVPAVVAAPQPIMAPALVAPVTAVPAQVATPAVVPTPGKSPTEWALELIHGKDMAAFFQVALPDELIRSDASLLDSIFNQTFVQAKLATGELTQNEDGTYTVPSLVTV